VRLPTSGTGLRKAQARLDEALTGGG
jgi:hypothetical protein